MIVVNGNGICTGALINNTENDGTPYFLLGKDYENKWSNFGGQDLNLRIFIKICEEILYGRFPKIIDPHIIFFLD